MNKNILILLLLLSMQSRGQGLFYNVIKNCAPANPCYYCGDTFAHYNGSLGKYFEDKIHNSVHNSNYELRHFDATYEVYVDSIGRTCVTSSKSLGSGTSFMLRNDLEEWLVNMPNWKPAIANGKPISSSVVVRFTFSNSYFSVKYVPIPGKKERHRKKKE